MPSPLGLNKLVTVHERFQLLSKFLGYCLRFLRPPSFKILSRPPFFQKLSPLLLSKVFLQYPNVTAGPLRHPPRPASPALQSSGPSFRFSRYVASGSFLPVSSPRLLGSVLPRRPGRVMSCAFGNHESPFGGDNLLTLANCGFFPISPPIPCFVLFFDFHFFESGARYLSQTSGFAVGLFSSTSVPSLSLGAIA